MRCGNKMHENQMRATYSSGFGVAKISKRQKWGMVPNQLQTRQNVSEPTS